MTSDFAAPAPETAASNGHGDSHSTAGFGALTLGSIGIVYGDIGTSPLYALREAVTAASAGGEVASQAVFRGVPFILLAPLIRVARQYGVILLPAEHPCAGDP